MLTSSSRLWANDKHVTASIIDGEAIIINLASGLYYSLDQTGALAWQLLSRGHSVGESAAGLAQAYGANAVEVEADLLRLAAELLEQGLVLGADAAAPQHVELGIHPGAAYTVPVLNAYDDMGDVLALDPPLPQVDEPAP